MPVDPDVGEVVGEMKVIGPTQRPIPRSGVRQSMESFGPVQPGDLPIYVDRRTLWEIVGYSRTNVRRELGGVLVGGYHVDGGREFIEVDAYIRARGESRSASFKFTHDAWSEITRIKDRDHPDRRIVGWHHTHPQFGIFLSGPDMFIQEQFFNLPWQVALVVDPVRNTLGFFQWRRGRVEMCGFHVVAADAASRAIDLAVNPA